MTVLEAAAGATNLPDACCDVVFLRNVYHHIRQPERFAASIARAVKPEGAIVVIDFEPGALWLHGGKPDDASRRPGHGVSRQDAVAEFRSAGFEPRLEVPRWSGPMWLILLRRVQSATEARSAEAPTARAPASAVFTAGAKGSRGLYRGERRGAAAPTAGVRSEPRHLYARCATGAAIIARDVR